MFLLKFTYKSMTWTPRKSSFGCFIGYVSSSYSLISFKKLGFTPCKAEQPLQGMELQEKEAQKA